MPYYWDPQQQISLPVPAGGVPGGGNGGLFADLLGGGQSNYGGLIGAAGGGDIDTDRLMNALIRRQLEQSMQPNFGAFAAALGKAAQPSLLPKSVGAALAEASGALSASNEGGDLKAMQALKLLQDMRASRQEMELRRALPGQIGKINDAITKWGAGGQGGGGATGNVVPGGALTGSKGGPQPGEMMAFATAIGASPNEAALLTSAAGAESSYNPTATHDGGIGYGMFGHNGDRLAAMRNQYGDAPSWQDQVRFALAELRSRPEGKSINDLTTAEDLTEAQMQFERPNRKINDGNFAGRLALTRQFMGAPVPAADPNRLAGSTIDLPEVPRYGSDLTAAPSASRGPLAEPTFAVPTALIKPGGAPGPTAALTQKQQYDADVAAGRRPMFPPGTRFNSRGEAISGDLRATPPGQQSGPNISAEMLRGFAQANALGAGAGGGIPDAVAEEPGGGGDDGGGLVAGGGARPPVPGIFGPQAAPAQPPVPGVFAPPAAAAPAAPPPPAAARPDPYAVPPTPAAPSNIPRPPMGPPDTRETQAIMAQIATLRAQTIAAKLGDPFGPMADMIANSPRFKAEQEAIRKSIEHPYEMDAIRARTEEAIREKRALHPLEIDLAIKRGEQERLTALQGMGLRRNPDTGAVEIDPGIALGQAFTKGKVKEAEARAEAGQRETEVVIDGEKHKVTSEEAGSWASDKGIERLGIPPGYRAQQAGAPGAPPAAPGAPAPTRGGVPTGQPVEVQKARLELDTLDAKTLREQATAGRKILPLLGEVTRLAYEAPGGLSGRASAELARLLPFPVPAGWTNAEVLGSLGQQFLPSVRAPGAQSNAEMTAGLQAVPGLMQSQGGRVKIAAINKAMIERTIEMADIYREHLGTPELHRRLAELDKKPLFSDEIRREIGFGQESQSGTAPGSIKTPYGTITPRQ